MARSSSGNEREQLQKSFDAHGGGATSVVFTQDGNLATSGRDGKVKFWTGDGTLKAEFTGLTEAALEVAAPFNGAQLIGWRLEWSRSAMASGRP